MESEGGKMSKNEIAVREHFLPSAFQNKNEARIRVFVEYEKIDDAEYAFISRPDQDTEIRIVPGAPGEGQGGTQTDPVYADAEKGFSAGSCAAADDIVDAAFDEFIPEKERRYYSAALACGLLCGALNEAPSVFSGFSFDEIESFEDPGLSGRPDENTSDTEEEKRAGEPAAAGTKKAAKAAKGVKGDGHKDLLRNIVVFAAQLDGFKGKEYKKALKYLISTEGPRAANQLHDIFADVLEEEVELSARPSLSGLLFSLLSQFSGMLYYADEKGDLWEHPVPDHYVIGDSKEDKILAGIMYWFFHASVISVRLGQDALKDKKIPGALRSLIKDLTCLCDFSSMPGDFEEAEIRYSEWLGKMIVLDRENDTEGMELFFILREKMNRVCRDTFPVVLNNCLVRAAYILCRIRSEAGNIPAAAFMDLLVVDPAGILPRNHRILSNMCLISAGAFAAVNIGHAALNVLFQSKERPKDKKISDFISTVNIVGIGNFIIAFAENTRYAGENIEVFLHSARWARYRNSAVAGESESSGTFFFEQEIQEILDDIVPNPVQLRLMDSLENLLVEYDISDTEKEKEIRLKKQWLEEWKQIVGAAVQEPADDWFITDEKVLFDELYRLSGEPEYRAWIYLMILELKTFTPYSGLGTGNDKDYKGLKSSTDYVKNTLIRMQTVATQEEADRMKKLYEKYLGIMSGSSRRRKIGTGAVIAAAAAGGSAALVFAPGIAAALVGKAFIGLHGAALTNACLAMLGGGSLAAGGFGMAGGTAVITGGGAILGGGGAIPMMAVMLTTSEGLWDEQYAKILVYGRYILRDCIGDEEGYRILRSRISAIHQQVENQLKDMKEERNSLDRETISLTESFLKYLRRLDREMQKK